MHVESRMSIETYENAVSIIMSDYIRYFEGTVEMRVIGFYETV